MAALASSAVWRRLRRGLSRLVAAATLLAGGAATQAAAATLTTLYSFCAQPGCADGQAPSGSLTADSSGNFYGTTRFGGTGGDCELFATGCGTVFSLSSDGTQTVLYSFQSPSDGGEPSGDLAIDAAGNLYGAGADFSALVGGTVFELPFGVGETVLYSFCARSGCRDGSLPNGGVVVDPSGNLFGTTAYGGGRGDCIVPGSPAPVSTGCGTVFEITPDGTEIVLHRFCSQAGCADGVNPGGTLVMDRRGNLYGTTGNAFGNGTVFEMKPPGGIYANWRFRVLYRFPNGSFPRGPLLLDAAGNLYGITFDRAGTVFELVRNPQAPWTETDLYSFCALANCADGAWPNAHLIMDQSGNLYGTTSGGGANDAGTIFELLPPAGAGNWQEAVLYSFCTLPGCADGQAPQAGLIMDASSNLYGTTSQGGANSGGTVFELTP